MPVDYPKIAVIIPCYRVRDHIASVIAGIPAWVEHIIVVDDACPDESGTVAESVGDKRVILVRHEANQGVGGAVISGYAKALELGCAIMVKMDGDGQMDPAYLAALIKPLVEHRADYAKGNRFRDFKALKSMPRRRLFANSAVSFWVKAASGYWNLMDPANGFTAVRRGALEQLDLDKLARDYFFESDMLIRLGVRGAVVVDQAMPARYGDEASSVSLGRGMLTFPPRLIRGFFRRLFLRYFVFDFNMASVYVLLGAPLLLFGGIFGAIEWGLSIATGTPRTVGTVMLVVLPIILGVQMLLQAVAIDIASVPKRPISIDDPTDQ